MKAAVDKEILGTIKDIKRSVNAKEGTNKLDEYAITEDVISRTQSS